MKSTTLKCGPLLPTDIYFYMNCGGNKRTVFQGCRLPWSYYRPQTKSAKVVFLQVSVCPRGAVPGQVSPTPWAGTPPRQVHPPGQVPPGRYPRQVHPPAGTHTPGQVQPRSTSGRYTSHWNAYLFHIY